MYAGNAIATVNMTDKLKFYWSVTAFEKISAADSSANIENIDMSTFTKSSTEFKKDKGTVSDRPDLVKANVVISGGRRYESAENFKLLDQLAVR